MERVTHARRYRGLIIETVEQDSGRKTYDVRGADGTPFEWAAESLAVARAIIDAHLEQGED